MDKMPFSINVLYGTVFIENTSDLSGGGGNPNNVDIYTYMD